MDGNRYLLSHLRPNYMTYIIFLRLETKRQTADPEEVGVGSAFDGSQGVDSEDIINIPSIGFGTFQLFPDQNFYGPSDPTLPAFNNTVNIGLDWISRHAEIGTLYVLLRMSRLRI